MRNTKAKKLRKECRIKLEELKAQKFKTRVKVAWEIVRGTKLNRPNERKK